jgi:hypothetical protein
MSDQERADPLPEETVPRGQRFFDNIFLLLTLGLVVMFVLYTGWGLWEIVTLPKATLP